MTRISSVQAREVLDSRGRPTVEVDVCCGAFLGRATVPSGASTGRHEARELRDGDARRLNGLGVQRAVANVRDILGPAVCGMDAADQSAVDARLRELDGTPDKSRLGANAILGVSWGAARAASAAGPKSLVAHLHGLWRQTASSSGQASARSSAAPAARSSAAAPAGQSLFEGPLLPTPMVNMISGGRHAGGQLRMQDFLIIPHGAASFRQALDWTVETYGVLGRLLTQRGHEGVLVGDEGGYGPRLPSHEAALQVIVESIERAGRRPGEDISLAVDVAATQFAGDGRYAVGEQGQESLSPGELIDLLDDWRRRYPIISYEDALHEDDWDHWETLTRRMGADLQLLGDDLFVTNRELLAEGLRRSVANSVLIKPNQIGTLSETLDTMRLAVSAGYRPVVSARSGDTEDPSIADLATATGAGQIKIGSVVRSERLAKYNQLLRIEEELSGRAGYAGRSPFR